MDQKRLAAQAPDSWIQRSEDLIPLTGPHPFNAEPPATLLMQKGFITPNPVHYVRVRTRVREVSRASFAPRTTARSPS